jgi:hypothetical protein
MPHKDSEKSHAYHAQYREMNREKARTYAKKYRMEHPEKTREESRQWRINNPERFRESTKKWRLAHPDKVRRSQMKSAIKYREKRYAQRRFRLYGITSGHRGRLMKAQNNRCAICGERFDEGKHALKSCVDHNHKTGQIRGLIHQTCNIGLGAFHDNDNVLRRAADYVKRETEPIRGHMSW